MTEAQNQSETQPRRSTLIFRAVAYLQTTIFISVFIFGFIKMILITTGGPYSIIEAFVFLIFFLPSLLLLIPDILLIRRSQKLSKAGQFLGYFFHTAALSWSFYLLKLALEN